MFMQYKRTFKDENGNGCFYEIQPTEFMVRTWQYRPGWLQGRLCTRTETELLVYPIPYKHFIPLCYN